MRAILAITLFSSVRLRLTLWHVAIVALLLTSFCTGLYIVLRRNSYASADNVLISVDDAVVAMLRHQLSESGLEELAARDAVNTLSFPEHTLEIFDAQGNLLAESPAGSSKHISLPSAEQMQESRPLLYTVKAREHGDELHRVAAIRVQLGPEGHMYMIVASRSLTPLLGELDVDRRILSVAIPGGLLLAGVIAWWLVRMTLMPVVRMSEQARLIGAKNLDQRFPAAKSEDEFTLLARTFNDLLERVNSSFLMQRQFVADASHELRTPLSVIRLTSAVTLQQTEPNSQEYGEALTIIDEQAKRMTRMVEDMFRLALADAGGGMSLERTAFYLDELIEDVLRAAAVIATPSGIQIHKHLSKECLFEGDASLLEQLLINLIDNAVKYSPRGGKIEVALTRSELYYSIRISDTGIGIELKHREHIFDRFYRVSPGHRWPASDLRSGGAGLGLAIARSIAEAHQGSLNLLDNNRAGSTFEILLPAHEI